MTLEEDYAKYQEDIQPKNKYSSPDKKYTTLILIVAVLIVYFLNLNTFYYAIIGIIAFLLLSGQQSSGYTYLTENEARIIMIEQLKNYDEIRRKYGIQIPKGEIKYGVGDMVENQWKNYSDRDYDYWEIGFKIVEDGTNKNYFYSMRIDAIKPGIKCRGVKLLLNEFNARTYVIQKELVLVSSSDYLEAKKDKK